MNSKIVNCYIYTRVSTVIQVDGFSLDAQKDKLRKYAEFQGMRVVGEYSDEGKSGKNINGRPEFQQMLDDIKSQKDNVSFVLVFKLSRFGRNVADVLSSLQFMQDYDCNLVCVEDGIDSSKDSGKLMISVLSAVSEIERENILVQTMAGRNQKAKEGKWNGGFAPYGYYLEKGELKIAEDEAETIRMIYDKYVHTNMGGTGIAKYLNDHGYKKKVRKNGKLDSFSAHFINGVIDNPVYCGKIAYGRRKTEKISGTRNQYHIVEQDEFPIYDGIHEAIISEEDWKIAQKKRKELSVKREKVYSLEHEHLLSGILVCPVCGAKMYGNVNRKKKPDGTLYKDYFFYACKHRLNVDGHRCDYHRQWNQDIINEAVEEVISKIVTKPHFEDAIKAELNAEIDTDELDKELSAIKKRLHQLNCSKDKLAGQIDNLDVTDKHYDKMYADMQTRLYSFYDEIELVENEIEDKEKTILTIKEQKISCDNVYHFLAFYDIMYKNFTDAEKKQFLKQFLESVEIFKEQQPSGQILKSITFKFPVFYDGENITEICWDGITELESVVLLTKVHK
ncbi:MAG: recombinase family protein [Clostridia bacterium]|nr:recombinase family protein [Clostridia bacterium]